MRRRRVRTGEEGVEKWREQKMRLAESIEEEKRAEVRRGEERKRKTEEMVMKGEE